MHLEEHFPRMEVLVKGEVCPKACVLLVPPQDIFAVTVAVIKRAERHILSCDVGGITIVTFKSQLKKETFFRHSYVPRCAWNDCVVRKCAHCFKYVCKLQAYLE